MRKKKIIEQNTMLFEELQKAKGLIKELNEQLSENAAKLSKAQQELNSLKNQNTAATAKAEPPLEDAVKFIPPNDEGGFDANDYGAKAIGALVLAAADYCIKLGEGEAFGEKKNLILGRTEVAKAEILSVVTGKDSAAVMQEKIDKIKTETTDYFESILAQ